MISNPAEPVVPVSFKASYSYWVIRQRYLVLTLVTMVTIAAALGIPKLEFNSNYRVYFHEDNPELQAFEAFEDVYARHDQILFVLVPNDDNVFTPSTLALAEELTNASWKLPYAVRVDSIVNFQHSYAQGDDLTVEQLVSDARNLSPADIERIRTVALAEPALRNRLIAPLGDVTAVSVRVNISGKDNHEIREITKAAHTLAAQLEIQDSGVQILLTGNVMLNAAFTQASTQDAKTLFPFVYLTMFLATVFLLRSLTAAFLVFLGILVSILIALGLAGWLGITLTAPSAISPTIITTLVVAGVLHVLVGLLQFLRDGLERNDAIAASLTRHSRAVAISSITTLIGFLSLNFSDVPPFRDLGNITAIGVVAAFAYATVILPALIGVIPIRSTHAPRLDGQFMSRIAEFVLRHRFRVLLGTGGIVVGLGLFVPTLVLNDRFVEYFDESMPFRSDTDFVRDRLTGIYRVHFSLSSGREDGINDPAYLERVETFVAWLEAQPQVVHVSAITDVLKRLNKNLHGDSKQWYRIPESNELAAQFLLFYEMSIPYGLDLNDTINVDRSASRITVTMQNVDNATVQALEKRAAVWLRENTPPAMHGPAVGAPVMFAHIAERNIKAMLRGSLVAVVLIAAALLVAFRSIRWGLTSLVPNVVPWIMAFGLWAILAGEMGLALSVVTAITLGIVVDDTVHFMSHYLHARDSKGLEAQDAVRYAFANVGSALLLTSIILAVGFAMLSLSGFAVNQGLGQMTALVVSFALVIDFTLLPTLLLALER